MTIILDLIAFIFCMCSAIYAYRLYLLSRSKYFIPIVGALMYATILRFIIFSVDLKFNLGISKANIQIMFSVYYILNFVGFSGIYLGLKKFLNK